MVSIKKKCSVIMSLDQNREEESKGPHRRASHLVIIFDCTRHVNSNNIHAIKAIIFIWRFTEQKKYLEL